MAFERAPYAYHFIAMLVVIWSLPAFIRAGCSQCGQGTECVHGRCHCKKGYVSKRWNWSRRDYTCTDVDECSGERNLCNIGTICVNEAGSYDCRCRPGWFGPWVTQHGVFTCTERSLCETNFHRCGQGTQCLTTNATTYTCTCAQGFHSKTISETEEIYLCSDIDECNQMKDSVGVCGQNSVCTNTPGSFTCKCNPGYRSAWKDDINCDTNTHLSSSMTNRIGVYKIGLAIGISLTAILVIIAGIVYWIKTRKQRRSSERRFGQHNQPIQISVVSGRESSYVNVTLNSVGGEKKVDPNEEDSPSHIYQNDSVGLQVSLGSVSIKKPARKRIGSGYVNHTAILQTGRPKSVDDKAGKAMTFPRPFSDRAAQHTSMSYNTCEKEGNMNAEKTGLYDEEYDRLCRLSNIPRQAMFDEVEEGHIYWQPDMDGSLDSVFEANRTSVSTVPREEQEVIYSLPNKPFKS